MEADSIRVRVTGNILLNPERGKHTKSGQKIFYGWWIVVGAFLLNFVGIGIIMNTMGVFNKPVAESLGFTRGGFTLYFTIAALSMMVMAPVMAPWRLTTALRKKCPFLNYHRQ